MTLMLSSRLKSAVNAIQWPVASDTARLAVVLTLLFIGADATVPQSESRAVFVSHLAKTLNVISLVTWPLVRSLVQGCIFLSKIRTRNFEAIFQEACRRLNAR